MLDGPRRTAAPPPTERSPRPGPARDRSALRDGVPATGGCALAPPGLVEEIDRVAQVVLRGLDVSGGESPGGVEALELGEVEEQLVHTS